MITRYSQTEGAKHLFTFYLIHLTFCLQLHKFSLSLDLLVNVSGKKVRYLYICTLSKPIWIDVESALVQTLQILAHTNTSVLRLNNTLNNAITIKKSLIGSVKNMHKLYD